MKTILVSVAVLIGLSTLAFPGVKLRMDTRSLDGPGQRTDWIYIDGENSLRIDFDVDPTSGQAETSTIFRADLETLFLLDHETREYLDLTRERIEQFALHIEEAFRQMQEQLAQLPEEQRARMEELRSKQLSEGSPEFGTEVARVGPDGDAEKYEVRSGDRLRAYVWVKPSDRVGLPAGTMQVFVHLTEFYEEMLDKLARIPSLQGLGGNPFPGFSKMNGVPVRIHNLQENDETTLAGSKVIEIDPAIFLPPADYTLMEIEEIE